MDRLEKFEKMLGDIINKLSIETEKINQLKMQEKEQSITYQYALNKQSIYTQMLQLYKDYGLLGQNGESMNREENYQNMGINASDLVNVLEELLVCMYEKWFYTDVDDEYVIEGFDQCRNYLLKRGPQGLEPFYEWIEDEMYYELKLEKEQLHAILMRKINE